MLLDFLLLLFTTATLCPVAFFWASCPCCGSCIRCSDSFGGSMQMVITGMANGDCTECAGTDGTFILPLGTSPTGNCRWQDTATSVVMCGVSNSRIHTIDLNLSLGSYVLTATVGVCQTSGSGGTTFEKNYGGTAPACATFSSESIPYSADVNNCSAFAPPPCDGSGATCLVTAI